MHKDHVIALLPGDKQLLVEQALLEVHRMEEEIFMPAGDDNEVRGAAAQPDSNQLKIEEALRDLKPMIEIVFYEAKKLHAWNQDQETRMATFLVHMKYT